MKCFLLTLVGALVLGLAGSAAAGGLMWISGSPPSQYAASGAGPYIWALDTTTGEVASIRSYQSYDWMRIQGIADSGEYLYAVHNLYDTAPGLLTHNSTLAKIDKVTGEVLSNTNITPLFNPTSSFSQLQCIEYKDGNLYGIDNVDETVSLNKGYAVEITLGANGDPNGGDIGAYYVGASPPSNKKNPPDGGLEYHNGVWYATRYRGTSNCTCYISHSTDIMNENFVCDVYSKIGPDGVNSGLFDGLQWDSTREEFLAVSWYYSQPVGTHALAVGPRIYRLYPDPDNPTLYMLTESIFDLTSQLPADMFQLTGMSELIGIPGDANLDWEVNDEDASILGKNWQVQSGASWFDGDFNNDQKVDDADAAIMAAHWSGNAEDASVPEPSTIALLLGAVVSLLVWRRRG
jgi:hypothetical protein